MSALLYLLYSIVMTVPDSNVRADEEKADINK